MAKKIDRKAKILSVTRSLLNEKAMDQISIREIAALAKVNVASVNYYFTSKDTLFTEALDEIIIEKQDEWLAQNFSGKKPARSVLVDYLLFLHQACVDDRGFAKTRVLSLLKADDVNAANMKIYDTLLLIAGSLDPVISESLLKLKVTLAFASMIGLSCSTKEVDAFNGTQVRTEEGLKKYVTAIALIIFPPPAKH